MTEFQTFIASDAGLALRAVLIVAALDFVTGTFAALRDGSFALDAIAAFLRKHVAGRVGPIGTLLFVGYYGGEAGQLFLAGAIAAASLYVAETASSVWGNIRPPKPSEVVQSDQEIAAGFLPALETPINPVPTD